jgi:FtsP/CotA-like multicopper oxidase with cupredoxin domain
LGSIKDEDRNMGLGVVVEYANQRGVTKVGDRSTAGLMKDTINMDRFSTVEIDFTADDPGPTLLHCHHQDHQDEGFMGLVTYL